MAYRAPRPRGAGSSSTSTRPARLLACSLIPVLPRAVEATIDPSGRERAAPRQRGTLRFSNRFEENPASSGPELALERGRRILQRTAVGAGREVLPAAVADDEADVGVATGGDLLVGDTERGVQDRAGRDAREDAFALHQLAGAVDGVLRPDGE